MEQATPAEKPLFDKLFAPSMILGLTCVLWLTAPEDIQETLKAQLAPGSLATNFAKEYSSWALTTLCHEAGHALVQSLASGRSSEIHLGSSTPSNEPPLFTIGNIHVDGLNPMHGYTPHVFVSEEQKEELLKIIKDAGLGRAGTVNPERAAAVMQGPEFLNLKQALLPDRKLYATFLLAGGLSGLLAHHGAQKLFSQPLRIDGITINQILNALFPMAPNSDGAALWRDCVGVPPAVINAAIEIAPLLEIAGELYVAFHDPQSTHNAPAHSKLLIGLINYFSRGYLRFHV